jgi:predicted RNA-binding protein with PIN domain
LHYRLLPPCPAIIFAQKTFMKRLLIDGYNLLNSRSFPVPEKLDLEGKREHLIRLLKSFAQGNGYKITLVFDNSQKPSRQTSYYKQIKIIFSAPGQEADEVIKQKIRREKSPENLTVVSSDLAIRFSAKDHGISSLSSEEFCQMMRSNPRSAPSKKRGSANPRTTDFPPGATAKYDSAIGEDEVQYWKQLFEKGKKK